MPHDRTGRSALWRPIREAARPPVSLRRRSGVRRRVGDGARTHDRRECGARAAATGLEGRRRRERSTSARCRRSRRAPRWCPCSTTARVRGAARRSTRLAPKQSRPCSAEPGARSRPPLEGDAHDHLRESQRADAGSVLLGPKVRQIIAPVARRSPCSVQYGHQ